jgi:hypothetical protein
MTRNHNGSHVPKKHEWTPLLGVVSCIHCGAMRSEVKDGDEMCPGKRPKVVVR